MSRRLIKTYIDVGIIIAVIRHKDPAKRLAALEIVTDPARTLIFSNVHRLELIPQAIKIGDKRQVADINAIVTSGEWYKISDDTFDAAISIMANVTDTLTAADALHITIALESGCDEFITTEDTRKPLYQVRGIQVLRFT